MTQQIEQQSSMLVQLDVQYIFEPALGGFVLVSTPSKAAITITSVVEKETT